MFAARYFGKRYFAGRYFGPAGSIIIGSGPFYPRRILIIN